MRCGPGTEGFCNCDIHVDASVARVEVRIVNTLCAFMKFVRTSVNLETVFRFSIRTIRTIRFYSDYSYNFHQVPNCGLNCFQIHCLSFARFKAILKLVPLLAWYYLYAIWRCLLPRVQNFLGGRYRLVSCEFSFQEMKQGQAITRESNDRRFQTPR